MLKTARSSVDDIVRLNRLREPRTVPIFELGLVLSRTFRCAFPIGNADFG
jgi:hypothetical protein